MFWSIDKEKNHWLDKKTLEAHKVEQEVQSELQEALIAHEQTGRQPATRKMLAYIMRRCADILLSIDEEDE